MENAAQIFQTNNSGRWQRTKWTFRIFAILLVFAIAVVSIAVINDQNPRLPDLKDKSKTYQAMLDPENRFSFSTAQKEKYAGFKSLLDKRKLEGSFGKRYNAGSLIRAAFYTPWNSSALHDLITNGNKLNTIYPEWFFIDTINFGLQTRIDSGGLAAMHNNKLSIQPMLTNFFTHKTKEGVDSGYFDSRLAHIILTNPIKRAALIKQISDSLQFYHFQGLNLDFEELTEKGNESLSLFQKELYEALHPSGMILTTDVSPGNEDYDYKSLAAYNDYIMLMAYDQYNDATIAGPISAQQWIENQLDLIDNKVDATRIILGISGYARDWIQEEGEDGKMHTRVEDLTYSNAIDNAKLSNAVVEFDNETYNLHYSYIEKESDSSSASTHTVWLTDAVTSFNILRFSDDYRTAGTALWHLGGEDPRIWTYYHRDLSLTALKQTAFDFNSMINMPFDVNTKPTATGEGELINILFSPQPGKVKLEIDSTEMLITEQQYLSLPSGYVYQKFAEDKTPMGPGHKIILTFDDGPDPEYTSKILDILEREHVPATFFVVGINVESNIPLLKRIFKDGYEIGNHTFTHSNVAKMNPERAELEMKTTRALIECITGHSTILFRAPYNADSEPATYEEIEPIARSKKENYITVGESIDPNDWNPINNADSIVEKTIRIAEENDASIILLHDAGGNTRQPTIDALPRIIAYFKKRGCHFTTVADLLGKTRDDIMPAVPNNWKNRMNWFFAESAYWLSKILFALFLVGIFLSIGRMIAMGIIASIQMKKEKKAGFLPVVPTLFPAVTVIVPGYNEELNAVRTIQSLLLQDYPQLQVLFIDDGSKDNTLAVLQAAFAAEPRVKIQTKPNGGKASALNLGIEMAETEYLVCIDADTQLKSDAISFLLKKFTDPQIGAVAGNVKVGNEVNMITRWQSIEYITSQNFDRRAFDLLNCITVVPGALGAFKKEAVIKAGGFTTDTLAEDCDLTMRLHRHGYKVVNCTEAISYTEAPETMKQFLKQRFRWSFGVMQSFWKHRDAVFNPAYKNFGMIALPNILIFQMILPFLAPLADFVLVGSLLAAGLGIIQSSISHILLYYLIFTIVDIAGAALAFAFEKENFKKLIWMLPQRLIYRQLMYYILIKSFNKALKGELQGWGVLKRTGNVNRAMPD